MKVSDKALEELAVLLRKDYPDMELTENKLREIAISHFITIKIQIAVRLREILLIAGLLVFKQPKPDHTICPVKRSLTFKITIAMIEIQMASALPARGKKKLRQAIA